MRSPRLVRFAVSSVMAAIGTSMAVLVAMRRGLLSYDPAFFAKVAGVVLSIALAALGIAIARRAWIASTFLLGVLLVYGGGMANYLYSLQGYALLTELEHVALADGKELQEFEAGPLSNVGEMDLTLQLEKLNLEVAQGALRPASRIRVIRKGESARVLQLKPGLEGVDGTLRFMQGAYGFAPRIVVTRHGYSVFDKHVPFTTRRIEGRGVAFEETFEIANEMTTVRAALDIPTSEDELKGHARLGVIVTREGKELGRGELTIGHFAGLSDGSYIGYAGLRRWSEVDIARRNYPEPMYAGAALMLASLVALPFAGRRR